MLSKRNRAGPTKVTNIQTDQEIGERFGFRTGDRIKKFLSRNVSKLVESLKAFGIERIDVSDVSEQAELTEQLHSLFTETFDIHRSTRCEMFDCTRDSRWTRKIEAPVNSLFFRTNEHMSANRAVRRELPLS